MGKKKLKKKVRRLKREAESLAVEKRALYEQCVRMTQFGASFLPDEPKNPTVEKTRQVAIAALALHAATARIDPKTLKAIKHTVTLGSLTQNLIEKMEAAGLLDNYVGPAAEKPATTGKAADQQSTDDVRF